VRDELKKLHDANGQLERDILNYEQAIAELESDIQKHKMGIDELTQENIVRIKEIMKLEHVNVGHKKEIGELRAEVAKGEPAVGLFNVIKERLTKGDDVNVVPDDQNKQ
jgi:chromosome segregation ATPase